MTINDIARKINNRFRLYRNKIQRLYYIHFDSENRNRIRSFKNIHEGNQCIIMATGPSLNSVDLSLIEDHPFVFGLNRAYLKRNNFKYYFCSSVNFFNHYQEEIKKVNAELFILNSLFPKDCSLNAIYLHLEPKKFTSLRDLEPNLLKQIDWGPTCLLDFAIPSALWMGFKEIILLGADYSLKEYKWFYQAQEEKRPEWPEDLRMQEMLMAHLKFFKLKEYLSAYKPDVNIINCSPLSDLTMFKNLPLEDAIKKIHP